MNVLEKIIAVKRQEVAVLKKTGLKALEEKFAAAAAGKRRSLRQALVTWPEHPDRPRIIAEIKKSSPSAGLLLEDFDPLVLAQDYQQSGAAALSVLTDRQFFQGSLSWLSQVRPLVELPLLRKEFIIDPIQVEESRLAGADAILLIAAVLNERELDDLQAEASKFGLECLVEVRDLEDVRKVCHVGAALVGINNRNLSDFSIDLNSSIKLAVQLPETALIVSESGIETPADIKKLQDVGINAFLIGTSLVKARARRQELLRELIS